MHGEKPTVHLLLVEDEVVYSRMILYQLSKLEYDDHAISVNHVSSLTELREIKNYITPDVILLDLGLPETSGLDTFSETKKCFPDSAVIILSGLDDELLAGNIVKSGAQDYLVKADADYKILRKAIGYALDRFKFQHTSTDSVLKYRNVFQNSPTPMFLYSPETGKIQVVNSALTKAMECTEEDELLARLEAQLKQLLPSDVLSKNNFDIEIIVRTCKGNELKTRMVGSGVNDVDHAFVCQFIPILVENTEIAPVSGQLMHELSEKIEFLKVYVKTFEKENPEPAETMMDLIDEIDNVLQKLIKNQE